MRCSEFFNRGVQDFNHGGILVSNVEITAIDTYDLCRNQYPLQKAVRIALQVVTILKRTRFPLIDIDGH